MIVYGKRINGVDIMVNDDVAIVKVAVNEDTKNKLKGMEERFKDWQFRYAHQEHGVFEARYARK